MGLAHPAAETVQCGQAPDPAPRRVVAGSDLLGCNEGDAEYRWRWGRPPFEDGSILDTLIGDAGQPAPAPQLHHEIELWLFQPPEVRHSDVVGLLTSIHQRLSGWVMPRVLDLQRLGQDGLTDQERAAQQDQPAADTIGGSTTGSRSSS